MQATGTLRESGFSKGFILVVVAMLFALVIGAAAGYAARSVSSAGTPQLVVQPKVDAVQGGPSSDLTRALPTAAPQVWSSPGSNPVTGYDVSQWATSNPAQPDSGLIP